MAIILITGITGLLGKHLAKQLIKQNNVIYGISRFKGEEIAGVKYIYGPLQAPDTYKGLPGNIEVCIHAAAAMPQREDFDGQLECIQTNIIGTYELVKHLNFSFQGTYIIVISTVYTYRPFDNEIKSESSITMPDTFYGLSKLYSEVIVQKSSLKSSVLRLSSFYDSAGEARNHQGLLYDWIERARKAEDLVIWGTGKERRDYLHIDDAVNAVLKAIEIKPTCIINIASPETLTTLEIAKTIIYCTNSISKIIIDSSKSFYGPIKAIDIAKAQKILNYQPNVSLANGIKKIISLEKA